MVLGLPPGYDLTKFLSFARRHSVAGSSRLHRESKGHPGGRTETAWQTPTAENAGLLAGKFAAASLQVPRPRVNWTRARAGGDVGQRSPTGAASDYIEPGRGA